jgi:DNA mismatch endonuclease, patch repair protein
LGTEKEIIILIYNWCNAMNKKKYIRDGRSPIPKSDTVSKVMSANKPNDTKPELILRKELREIGLSGYRLHWKKAPGRPDIAYPGRKIGIFVHGCFWHRCPLCNLPLPKSHQDFWEEKFRKNKERDSAKIHKLEDAGWKVFVFWECEIKEDVDKCARTINDYIRNYDHSKQEKHMMPEGIENVIV